MGVPMACSYSDGAAIDCRNEARRAYCCFLSLLSWSSRVFVGNAGVRKRYFLIQLRLLCFIMWRFGGNLVVAIRSFKVRVPARRFLDVYLKFPCYYVNFEKLI